MDINAKNILLNALAKPGSQRIRYWRTELKQSGYSPNVFWRLLKNELHVIRSTMNFFKKDTYKYGTHSFLDRNNINQLEVLLEKCHNQVVEEPVKKKNRSKKI